MASESVPIEMSLRERLLGGARSLSSNVSSETGTISSEVPSAVPSRTTDKHSALAASAEKKLSFESNSQDSTASNRTQNSCDSQCSTVSGASSVSGLPPADFAFAPDSFDIILCVDNREFYGGFVYLKHIFVVNGNKKLEFKTSLGGFFPFINVISGFNGSLYVIKQITQYNDTVSYFKLHKLFNQSEM